MNQLPRHALCKCGSLLIDVPHFRGVRWLCMSCGLLFQNPPRSQVYTVETERKKKRLEDEFDLACGNHLIVNGLHRADCPRCMTKPGQEHMLHATERDWQLCNDAIKWLSERTGREFAMVNGDVYHAGSTPPVTPEQYLETLREMRGEG